MKDKMIAMILAATMSEVFPSMPELRRTYDGPPPPKPENIGRRAEKDAAAQVKAEIKRQRKMAKRAKPNVK